MWHIHKQVVEHFAGSGFIQVSRSIINGENLVSLRVPIYFLNINFSDENNTDKN